LEFHSVSAATGEGIPALVHAMADVLERLGPRHVPDAPQVTDEHAPVVEDHESKDAPEEEQ
jgi:hypothetical protein